MASPQKAFPSGSQPPTAYDRPAEFDGIIREKDVAVAMRDGVHLAVDIYRPDASGKFPALLAFGVHSKELQGDEYPKHFPPQPSWSSLWLGHMEAGDTRYFVSRGYVQVIAQPRGRLKSDDGGARDWDSFDLIEWIARQPWCGASEQFHVARQRKRLFRSCRPCRAAERK